MQIKTVKVGYLETNCYILENENECLVIDPGDEIDKIVNNITKKLVGIIVTHHHFDHIGALDLLQKKYDVKVFDFSNLNEGSFNINDFKFEVIYTKGHHNTCVTIYFKEEKLMFVGDFIFRNSIGRIDLEGSDEKEMYNSLSKIKKYSDDITLYPGHGENTTLGYEKENNYFFS